MDSGLWISCKWNLDPRFQTLAGFRILWDESLIPKRYIGPVNDFIGVCLNGREYNKIYRINLLYFRDVHDKSRCGQMNSTLFFSDIYKTEID